LLLLYKVVLAPQHMKQFLNKVPDNWISCMCCLRIVCTFCWWGLQCTPSWMRLIYPLILVRSLEMFKWTEQLKILRNSLSEFLKQASPWLKILNRLRRNAK
jgi:hypothetical protein